MEPVLFEAACVIKPEDPQWKQITSLALEIGYPGKNGPILWKHVGWIKEQSPTNGRTFSHALWSPDEAQNVVVLDFIPVIEPESNFIEETYRIRKNIFHTDGRQQTTQSGLMRGDYTDDMITLKIHYPELNIP